MADIDDWLRENWLTIRKFVFAQKCFDTPGYSHDDLFADVVLRIVERHKADGTLPAPLKSVLRLYVREAIRHHVDPSRVGLTGYNPSRVVQYAKAHRLGTPASEATRFTGDSARCFDAYRPYAAIDLDGESTHNHELSLRASMVRNALSRLPTTSRKIAQMHFFDGLSIFKIRKKTGHSAKVIGRAISLARTALLRVLSSVEDEA